MKRFLSYSLVLCGAALGQETNVDRVSVALSDPARPGLVRATLHRGGITVKAYDGKEVIVEARARVREISDEAASKGMRRIAVHATGLVVEEENNVVSVGVSAHNRAIDLSIQVPRRTSLRLRCHNDGNVVVEQAEGEIEVTNHNGSVTLTNIAGSAVANTHNGAVKVVFARVDPSKAMAFSSWNGAVDVTLPGDAKANVKIKSERGDVFSDFELKLQESAARQVVEDNRPKGGKYRVRIDKSIYATINGGGPEMQFANYNGPIYIRKAGQ
jgi:DUF4097 and DUF4098 domain-containing protein YvlB